MTQNNTQAAPRTTANTKEALCLEAIVWLFLTYQLLYSFSHAQGTRVYFCSLLFFYVFSVILHELAHAGALALTGGSVSKIKLGRTQNPSGPHLKIRFLSFAWEIYATPMSGSVWGLYYSEKYYRTSACVMVAAGPLINLAAGLSALLILLHREDMTAETFHLTLSWISVNFFIFLATAIPRQHPKYRTYSDGYRFVKYFSLKDDEVHQRILLNCFHRDLKENLESLNELTISEHQSLHLANPHNLAVLASLVDKMRKHGDFRVSSYLVQILNNQETPIGWGTGYIDGVLTQALIDDEIPKMEGVEQVSHRLLNFNPSLSIKGTHGAVLVDLGKHAEGKQVLETVLQTTESNVDKLFCYTFLAIVAATEGESETARKYAELARSLHQDHPILRRLPKLSKLPS